MFSCIHRNKTTMKITKISNCLTQYQQYLNKSRLVNFKNTIADDTVEIDHNLAIFNKRYKFLLNNERYPLSSIVAEIYPQYYRPYHGKKLSINSKTAHTNGFNDDELRIFEKNETQFKNRNTAYTVKVSTLQITQSSKDCELKRRIQAYINSTIEKYNLNSILNFKNDIGLNINSIMKYFESISETVKVIPNNHASIRKTTFESDSGKTYIVEHNEEGTIIRFTIIGDNEDIEINFRGKHPSTTIFEKLQENYVKFLNNDKNKFSTSNITCYVVSNGGRI